MLLFLLLFSKQGQINARNVLQHGEGVSKIIGGGGGGRVNGLVVRRFSFRFGIDE